MANLTGRACLEAALKKTLPEHGWRPRAVGWFTRPISGPWTGVLAVAAASHELPAGHAHATLHVGLHHAGVEAEVARLAEVRQSYQLRTVVTPIGYVMPQHRWTEWTVSPANASLVAAAITAAVCQYVEPYMTRLVNDPLPGLVEQNRGWLVGSKVELARRLAVARILETRDLGPLLAEANTALAARSDLAAQQAREVLSRLGPDPGN